MLPIMHPNFFVPNLTVNHNARLVSLTNSQLLADLFLALQWLLFRNWISLPVISLIPQITGFQFPFVDK